MLFRIACVCFIDNDVGGTTLQLVQMAFQVMAKHCTCTVRMACVNKIHDLRDQLHAQEAQVIADVPVGFVWIEAMFGRLRVNAATPGMNFVALTSEALLAPGCSECFEVDEGS